MVLNRKLRPAWITLLAGLFLALLAAPDAAEGQAVTTATVTGRTSDPAGAPLGGVQVVVTNQATGVTRGVITRADGRFTIPGLQPGGPYTAEARLIGYETDVAEAFTLGLGQLLSLEFVLGQQAVAIAGVEVVADRGSLGTGVTTTVRQETIENAPTLGREIVDVARLTPQAFVVNEDDDGAAVSIAGQNNEYNSLFIDGVVNNDVFGLSAQGTNGGQSGAPPISYDAIEQMQIAISPFDVTQGGFTGGAINAITRSGTNTLAGSLYYQFRNEDLAGKTPPPLAGSDPRERLPDFTNARYGFRLGGPIVQDKAFFFINGELFRSETPRLFTPSVYRGGSIDRLDQIREVVQQETGYDPGSFGDKASTLDDNKVLAKIDWNFSDNHRLTARHSYSHSDNVDAFESGVREINYANNNEIFPNTTNSTAVELNSAFGGRYANKLVLGLTYVRDDRDYAGDPFPYVSIIDEGARGEGEINLGSDQFSTGNILNQDIFTVTNNFNIFAGRHTITIGTHNEFYSINNLFIRQNFGSYRYASVDDFLQSVCAAGTGASQYCQDLRASMGVVTPAAPERFQRGFSLIDNEIGDASEASANFSAYQLGVYVQDDFQMTNRLRLTGGIRVDVPNFTTKPRFSDDYFTTTLPLIETAGYDLDGAVPGETPDALPYIAPRLGFNYNLTENGVTRLRGGVGVFTGRVPFVYPGAMYTNNGTTVGFVSERGRLPNRQPIPFVPDPRQALDATDFNRRTIPSGELDIFEEDFRYPRVFRTSLGVDTELPYGFVATLEGQYTKNIDNIIVTNVNFKPQNDQLDGPDNRPVYNYGISTRFGSFDTNATVLDRRYTSILKVGTTSEGYTYDVTGSLSKEFGENLSARFSVTYGDAFSVNDATSDQIFSVWRFNENVRGLNDLDMARSDFSLGTRVLGQLTYSREFLGNLGTTISAIYAGETGRPFSFIIGNNFGFTGEGSGTSPLVYIPAENESLLFTDIRSGGTVVRTAAEQEAAFNAFVDNNDYLRSRRGDYAERNATRLPFEHVIDLRIAQEIFGNIAGRRNGVELTLDIFNFTNLLNSEWGLRYDAGFRTVDLLRFERFRDPVNGDLTPIYTFRLPEESMDEYWEDRLIDFGNYGSRWLMQLGARYTF